MRHSRNQFPQRCESLGVPQPILQLLLAFDIFFQRTSQAVDGYYDSLNLIRIVARWQL